MIRADSAPDEPGWTLRYDGFVPAEEGLREALCTVHFACHGDVRELRPGCTVEFCFPE